VWSSSKTLNIVRMLPNSVSAHSLRKYIMRPASCKFVTTHCRLSDRAQSAAKRAAGQSREENEGWEMREVAGWEGEEEGGKVRMGMEWGGGGRRLHAPTNSADFPTIRPVRCGNSQTRTARALCRVCVLQLLLARSNEEIL
jgi:hypothetical protein